jgi:cytochrome c oxidase accessory protein FixG
MSMPWAAASDPLAFDDSNTGSFYASRPKVYPRAVDGLYRRIKWAFLVVLLGLYYTVPWLRWDRGPGAPDQAILVDLPGGRAYFLWIEIWPQEVYYLSGLLILAAVGLFLATSLLGRIWCGYACPQTVWTDLFLWVERLIEGDRVQRMRLDRQPLSAGKIARKAAKHAAWLLIALATGGAWIFYFADAPTVAGEIVTGRASLEVYSFIALFTSTTYLLAGWAREQVCTYMCPWPRIQAAMLDVHSLVVTYRDHRGEPRGKHRHGTSWEGRGDCVDCQACVAVCPTGIDIRDGQQLECIGCGLCIDACNEIMARVGRPTGLIAFDTLANLAAVKENRPPRYRLLRPRTVIYAALMLGVGAIMAAGLALRSPVGLTVLRDRSPLFVRLSDGAIRNGYTVKILNKSRAVETYRLSVEGLPEAHLALVGDGIVAESGEAVVEVRPDAVGTFRLTLRAERRSLKGESTEIRFRLDGAGAQAVQTTTFVGPKS